MMRKLLYLCSVILALPLAADTLVLSTGATIDGVVKTRSDGILEVTTGDRTVFYRPNEIVSHEVNDRKGGFDMDAIRARVAQKRQEMEEKTGLTLEQRERVDDLLHLLATASSDGERIRYRDQLVNLQTEFNVYRYLSWRTSAVLHPWTLEVMYNINPSETVPKLRRGTQDPWYETRREAVMLLGRMGVQEAAELVVRGLADHTTEVQLAATIATGQLKALTATPVLIEQLAAPDMRISNASREALEGMWASRLGSDKPETVSDWEAFWKAQPESGQQVYARATLQPLIPEEDERIFE
jgi:hypothetical protein